MVVSIRRTGRQMAFDDVVQALQQALDRGHTLLEI
jgi:hypothetical protein